MPVANQRQREQVAEIVHDLWRGGERHAVRRIYDHINAKGGYASPDDIVGIALNELIDDLLDFCIEEGALDLDRFSQIDPTHDEAAALTEAMTLP